MFSALPVKGDIARNATVAIHKTAFLRSGVLPLLGQQKLVGMIRFSSRYAQPCIEVLTQLARKSTLDTLKHAQIKDKKSRYHKLAMRVATLKPRQEGHAVTFRPSRLAPELLVSPVPVSKARREGRGLWESNAEPVRHFLRMRGEDTKVHKLSGLCERIGNSGCKH
jgi:hypothetical protein